MTAYEYKVVPAPSRGLKAKGVKGPEGRFANALETVMNDLAAQGWEYLRADTLPSEERTGLTSHTTTYRNVLVFRRVRADAVEEFAPRVLDSVRMAKLPPPAPEPAPAPARAERPADDDPFLMGDDEDASDGKVHPLPVALLARARAHPPQDKDSAEDVAAE